MMFLSPIWLLLSIPLAVSVWMWKLPTGFLQVMRISTCLCVLLAMCGLAVKLPSRSGTVVVVADRSLSMPPNSDATEKETIDLVQNAMSSDDRLAVVAFGESSVIERFPQGGKFGGFSTEIGKDASNLAEGLEKALSLISPDSPGKILVLSDGHWTGRNPAGIASQAATRGIALDYRALQRSSTNDVAIAQIDAPARVNPNESFMLTTWVRSPVQQEVTYELIKGNSVLASGKRTLDAGLTRLIFRDTGAEAGTQIYTIKVVGTGQDPIPENNTARVLVGVEGQRPVLCVTSDPNVTFSKLLSAGGVQVKAMPPENCSWTLEDLSKYSAVILENIPAEKLGVPAMENLAAWVTETGAGLMMTGGKNAFGPGGYFRSPLEPILPVSMELKREHRKLALSIVVTMDRSGSMAMPAGSGRTKMDLANLGAVQVLDLLSPMDEFGVIAVDSAPHTIADLAPVENPAKVLSNILRVDSGGGGIFIYEALAASSKMLLPAKSGTRHIILFADASDSEEPGQYKELIEECRKANMTVSVIGLGKPTDSDADLLRDIASRGGGRCYFTDNPDELPRLFAQDTFIVARSTFLDQITPVKFTGGLVALTGKQFPSPVQVGGYNLCYLRPGANLAAVTVDEYQSPFVAAWQAGIGRTLSYTGEVNGQYTGPIAGWKEAGEYFSSLARWTAGTSDSLPENMLLTQELRNGVNLVQLHLDPEKETQPFREIPKVTTLRGLPGRKPTIEQTALRWASPDTLTLEVPLHGNETSLSTVEVQGIGKFSLPPVVLPYSPEFKPVESAEGQMVLEHLAQTTGGVERLNLASIWKDLPKRPRFIELSPWLLALAALMFLLEVLERRTRLVSGYFPQWRRKPKVIPTEKTSSTKPVRESNREIQPGVPVPAPKTASKPVKSESPSSTPQKETVTVQESKPGMLDALRQARRQAQERTEREK